MSTAYEQQCEAAADRRGVTYIAQEMADVGIDVTIKDLSPSKSFDMVATFAFTTDGDDMVFTCNGYSAEVAFASDPENPVVTMQAGRSQGLVLAALMAQAVGN